MERSSKWNLLELTISAYSFWIVNFPLIAWPLNIVICQLNTCVADCLNDTCCDSVEAWPQTSCRNESSFVVVLLKQDAVGSKVFVIPIHFTPGVHHMHYAYKWGKCVYSICAPVQFLCWLLACITILQVHTKDYRIFGSLHQSDAQMLAQLWRSARPWVFS